MSKKGDTLIELLGKLGITPKIMCIWLGDQGVFETPKWPLNKKGLENLAIAMEGGYEEYDEEEDKPTPKVTLEQVQELGEIKFVESGGVYHDGGSIWSVFYFKKFDVNLAAEATYSSWDDKYYSEDWAEVKEKEITITQWLDSKGRTLA